jgi:hypothetical protein
MNALKSVCHRDGSVTYWSVLRQVWIRHARDVDDEELATWSAAERYHVLRHFAIARGCEHGPR